MERNVEKSSQSKWYLSLEKLVVTKKNRISRKGELHKQGYEDVEIIVLYQEALNKQTVMNMYILNGNNNFFPL